MKKREYEGWKGGVREGKQGRIQQKSNKGREEINGGKRREERRAEEIGKGSK